LPTPGRGAGGLRRDQDYLLRGDVFKEDDIDTWIWYKTVHEVEALRQQSHPCEFAMYFDNLSQSIKPASQRRRS
jgi:hypothetical protein